LTDNRTAKLSSGDDKTAASVQLDYASPPPKRPVRPWALVVLAIAAVLAGPVVGATTNTINGAVSPIYFLNIMGWEVGSYAQVREMAIVQGILEGSVVGFIFSVILTLSVGIVTRATCTLPIALCWLGWTVLYVYAAWAIGGICGMAWAAANPRSFQNTFFGVPADHAQMLRFAWVGGSIWGAEFGGLLVVIAALIWFRIIWRRRLAWVNGGNTPQPTEPIRPVRTSSM
jgi:hypothetical protein